MKVLFLDIDGVLNLYPNPSRSGLFDKQTCINLEFVLNRVPDLKIVISSSWRTYGLEVMRDFLSSNGIDPRRIIDVTGHEQSTDNKDHRGFQVECWLKRNPSVKKFVILDDESDFVPLKHKLVKTDKYAGLTQLAAEKVLDLLA